MIKHCYLYIVCILCVLTFSSCTNSHSQKTDVKEYSSVMQGEITETDEFTALKNNKLQGMYSFQNNNDTGNIVYSDFEQVQEIYLCNAPSCAHSGEECTSFLSYSQAAVLTDEKALYILTQNTETQPSKIYTADLDGSNRRLLYARQNGELLGNHPDVSSFYGAANNETLCFFVTDTINGKYKFISMPLNGTEPRELASLDIAYQIKPLDVYDNSLIVLCSGMPEGSISQGGIIENSVLVISLDNGEIKTLSKWNTDLGKGEYRESFFADGVYCYLISGIGENVGKLYAMQYSTGEESLISENCPTMPVDITWEMNVGGVFIEGLVDNKLIIITDLPYEVNGLDTLAATRYSVDIISGAKSELTLSCLDANRIMPIKIKGQTEDKLAVLTEIRQAEGLALNNHSLIRNTYKQTEIISLISKADFLANKPDYIEILPLE